MGVQKKSSDAHETPNLSEQSPSMTEEEEAYGVGLRFINNTNIDLWSFKSLLILTDMFIGLKKMFYLFKFMLSHTI